MLARTPSYQLIDRTKLEPWRKLLLDAADGIEAKGHAKGMIDDSGAMCVVGALSFAARERWRLIIEAIEPLRIFLGVPCVVDWQDAPERTAAEVIDTMRACAMEGLS